jgi:hypothetical protein
VTPTWAVILVGLGSAVIGSLFTTLATISHERAAELRTRMLNAADEFSTAASAAIQQMYVAAIEIRRDGTGERAEKRSKAKQLGDERRFSPTIQAHLDRVDEAVDDTAAKQARITLLFGDESLAGDAANRTVSFLRSAKLSLGDPEQMSKSTEPSLGDPEQMSSFDRSHLGAFANYQRFNSVALEAIERSFPSWHRYWGRRRRRKQVAAELTAAAQAVPTQVPPLD